MRISISNIAWDVHLDSEVAALLGKYGIDAIDVAPGKYFTDFNRVPLQEVHKVRQWWEDRGIGITGMQSLLFGTQGLNLFAGQSSQQAMLEHLTGVCRVAAGLGASKLVFGSPKNRDRSGVAEAEVMPIAREFFSRLGDIAALHSVVICLEPNPKCYGANFMTTTRETAEVVSRVAHPAIRMQLDTGALTLNGESVEELVPAFHELIAHIHASEPQLVTLGDGGTEHARIAKIIEQTLPNRVVCIEMLPANEEAPLAAIERAVTLAVTHYRLHA